MAAVCECARRGMTGGKAHPLCPVHGPRDVCFELDGARVHGDPDMSDEARNAVRDVIAAARRLLGEDESDA